MAFESSDGNGMELWFGRIQRLLLQSEKGKRAKLLLHAVDMDKNISGRLCVCVRFYSKVPRKPRTYKYGISSTVDIELDAYPVTSVLHIVDFDYDQDRDEYKLDRDQYNTVMDKLNDL